MEPLATYFISTSIGPPRGTARRRQQLHLPLHQCLGTPTRRWWAPPHQACHQVRAARFHSSLSGTEDPPDKSEATRYPPSFHQPQTSLTLLCRSRTWRSGTQGRGGDPHVGGIAGSSLPSICGSIIVPTRVLPSPVGFYQDHLVR